MAPAPASTRPGATLGEVGQAGRLVHRPADHRVLVALLGADVAGDERARRHADGGVEAGVGRRQRRELGAQGAGGPQRAGGVVGLHRGRAEHAQRAVALELVDPAALGRHDPHDRAEEAR